MSLSYTFIFFELIIVPLSEITPEENYLLMFFSGTSLIFLYFTTNVNAPNTVDLAGEHLLNKNGSASICPACKLKMEPRNFHCKICMECIPKYDHHSYWLNCCIGGKNFHCYLAGIFFGVFALAFASLLILTTICTPEYVFGILVPEDCTDVCSNIETCTCLVCGIYCMELSAVLLFKVLHHAYLISRGFSMFEWSEQLNHKIGKSSPHFAAESTDEAIEKFTLKFIEITKNN
ncbi:hypothetical protein RUM43_011250 [Polyplax serrata]|uniref:Palmitoyltransferase n=1 Tax=Polyplax serrata TaxID=468196 RepID=A0AAN8NTF5_POLSC